MFTYTAKYPDEGPEVEVEDSVNFEDNCEKQLIEHIKEAVKYFI